jgi:predicted Zn-dependent protease
MAANEKSKDSAAWTEKLSRDLAKKIFSFSKAPECELSINVRRTSYTRFAANDVTTAGSAQDLRLTITSRGKGRSGTVTVNDTAPDVLRKAVARSEELMAIAPEDPEFVEGLPAQSYPAIQAFHETTAAAGAAERRPGVKAALDLARGKTLAASGFYETGARWNTVANKKGNFGFHASTDSGYSVTMRTGDGTGSGWAGGGSPKLGDLAPEALATAAATKAESSARPRQLAPGKYTVILEPQAVNDLLSVLMNALNARNADEGRSYFAKPGGGTKLGELVFSDKVTLRTDPTDARVPSAPWADERLPARATTWVDKGVLKALFTSRYWARKTDREPLPMSGNLVMDGGQGTVADLIASADRALLVTRFWYIRSVNPQTVQLTGLTRDGIWLVEKGKVVAPVNNLRFNESPALMLKNVEALSAAVSTGEAVVPGLRARNFTFSSRSDAV